MATGHPSRWSLPWLYVTEFLNESYLKKYIDIQEIYGSHYVLPELGPLGGNGLANVRDFESPVASFDIDQSPWNSTLDLS